MRKVALSKVHASRGSAMVSGTIPMTEFCGFPWIKQ